MTGGDITEITFNHPTLGSGTIYPKANEDSTFDPGGFRTDDDQDSIAGNGAAIYKKTRKRWMFETTCAVDMNEKEEVEILSKITEQTEEADWTISSINGTVYGGKGLPVGDLNWNGNASTFTFKVSGGVKLLKIVG